MSRELKPQHHPLCRWLPTVPCTCGLDRLRAEVAALKRALRTIADGTHFVGAARHVASDALSPKRAASKRAKVERWLAADDARGTLAWHKSPLPKRAAAGRKGRR